MLVQFIRGQKHSIYVAAFVALLYNILLPTISPEITNLKTSELLHRYQMSRHRLVVRFSWLNFFGHFVWKSQFSDKNSKCTIQNMHWTSYFFATLTHLYILFELEWSNLVHSNFFSNHFGWNRKLASVD